MNKIILYIAISLDGYIADKHGGVDWLPQPKSDAELKAVGYKNLMLRIDTILMGSNSYKQILGFGDWGWQDKQTYVFTSKKLENDKPYINITHENPKSFVQNHTSYKDIWLLGGANLARSFAQANLIDEIILTIVPQTLGEGIPLGLNFDNFELISETPLIDSMIQKSYLHSNKTNKRIL